jgi:hypothetical protein
MNSLVLRETTNELIGTGDTTNGLIGIEEDYK